MAYYDKMSKRPMSKQDHMKKDASEWKKDEGSSYRSGKDRRPSSASSAGRSYGGKTYRPSSSKEESAFKGGKTFRPAGRTDFRQGSRDPGRGPAAGAKKPYGDPNRPSAPRPPRPVHPAPASPSPAPVRPRPVSDRRFEVDMRSPEPENLISGRNPIREALKSGRDIEKLLVAKGDLNGTAREIVAMAREQHIPVQTVERSRLDEICRGHQGMLAYASAYRYYDVEDMLADAEAKGEKPFLIILDGVTDPMNLGAIIRTAACAGAHGVIVPQRRAVGLTPSAVKASAGAVEKVKVARVTNLARTLDDLKQHGLWMFAADMSGTDYRKVDFSGAVGLVIGSEGDGISRLTLEKCDHRVSLPMTGAVDSLNASVAAGILMYAIRSFR